MSAWEGFTRSADVEAVRPWFDDAGLFALRHWFFPLSRLWAAAGVAGGDAAAFHAAVPMIPRLEHRDRVVRALAHFEEARAAANAMEAEWERVFFGTADVPETYRFAVESARHKLRHAFYASRRHFRFMVRPDVPRVKLAIEGSGTLRAQGTAQELIGSIEGSGDLGLAELDATSAELSIEGSGAMDVRVAKSLHYSIEGSGSIRYSGAPELSGQVDGSGSVGKSR